MSLTAIEKKQGWTEVYGIEWPPMNGRPMPRFRIEMAMYRRKDGVDKSKGWLGESEHMKRGLLELFAHRNCLSPFEINPNTERMIESWCECMDMAFVGYAGSTKSYGMAAFGLWEFLCDPENTGVIITSTTLGEAKLRIWGHIARLWQDACANPDILGERNMPGKLVASDGLIRYTMIDPTTRQLRKDDQRGMKLVAGALAESDDAVEKMKGFHPPRLIVLLDELSDISPSIPAIVESNLKKTEYCKVCAGLNARDLLDAGGIFCEPKAGWDSIKVNELARWEGKGGKVILRFDGKYSPNKILGEQLLRGEITQEEYIQKKWKGLLDLDQWNKDVDDMGESSPNFLKQNRAIWPTAGSAEVIYTHDLLLKSGCKKKVQGFLESPEVIACLDPAFSNGGDRCPLVKCHFGKARIRSFGSFQKAEMYKDYAQSTEPIEEGTVCYVLQYIGHRDLNDHIDPTKDRNMQIVEHAINYLDDATTGYVKKKNFGMDITGAGSSLATLFGLMWGQGFYKIDFHGAPTDRPLSATDRTPMVLTGKQDDAPKILTGKDMYEDRVSEIWGVGEQYMRGGQIKNLPEVIQTQLNKRPYKVERRKLKVTPKKKMKTRSPDEADAFLMCLDLAREIYNFLPSEKAKATPKEETVLIITDSRGKELFNLTSLAPKKGQNFKAIQTKMSFYNKSS